MTTSVRWTSTDLASLPDNGNQYEIIEGELYMSKQPHWHHQRVCGNAHDLLNQWSRKSQSGLPLFAPGLIFSEDNDVAPDVIWVSFARFSAVVGDDGKLHGAPELVIEVISPGSANEHRDREAKRKLYSRRGVQEYWIVDWRTRQVEVYRRQDAQLQLLVTLFEPDRLTTPLLADFECQAADFFDGIAV